MKIRLISLTLLCRRGQETIDFSPQVSFYHGKLSAGKSTIARLIDYCLGAKEIERTTAIKKELLSVELLALVGRYVARFERTVEGVATVQVTWTDEKGKEFGALAPLQQPDNAAPLVEGESVFTFSDLMFYLFGMQPLRVKKSNYDEESELIRLSIRDILWYCYLDQNKLDHSFFRLHEIFVQTKSRYAIRYILGYYTERLEELQRQLKVAITNRTSKLAAAKQIREFLQEVGYETEMDVEADITETTRQFEGAKRHQAELQATYHAETHFADTLRNRLRDQSAQLGMEEQALADLKVRLSEFELLKGELLTARHKLSRAATAATVLSDVAFESCPQCGTKVTSAPDPSCCNLCGKATPKDDEARATIVQALRRDLDSRLKEIDDTLGRTKRSIRKQEHYVATVRADKHSLDSQLNEELSKYDSPFIAATREADRRTAMLEERLSGLERFRKLPATIASLEREADTLVAEAERLRRQIQEEHAGLISANRLVGELEGEYLRLLLAVGVPGVNQGDVVRINRKTWIPDILEGGEDGQSWNFYGAGSNGKKTLLNVCYALAVHIVAEAHDRPLPTFLLIDHVTKCISPDVNRSVIEALFREIYSLVLGPLKRTQVILIDNEFFAPEGSGVNIVDRYLTPDDENHPPLISYYRGA
ncbi:MAG: hypothetical protein R3B84_00215 [Zavarzinella sp.]